MTSIVPEIQPTVEGDVESVRAARKATLAAAFRIFGRLGFNEGVAGHITVRDPEHLDHFWVNPFAVSFRMIGAEDLICVNAEGDVVEGDGMLNRAAFAIHSRIHAARPDVIAAAHSHSVYGKAFSALHRELRPLTQDACIFFEDHALFDDYTGVVWDTSEGDRIAETLGMRKALILANHGLLTTGHSIEEAVFWFVTMERTCQAELAVLAAGGGVPIPDDVARHTYAQVGSHAAGHFSATPLFDWIRSVEPDL
ncbi:MAG: class II aldolase/adducin family protein [Actinobacteria bacterium]|nr:class II aldolase/adducin family protein [Actinomycetota bacterium]